MRLPVNKLLCQVLGSFTGVVIDRLPIHKSFIKGRSICESCKKELEAIDLVPLVSFIVFQGKCRRCKKPIPQRLFILEVLGGGMLVALYYIIGISFGSISLFIFFALVLYSLLAIFFIDIDHGIIPDEVLIFLCLITCGYLGIFEKSLFVEHFISGIAACAFFLMLFILTRGRGIGFGDVKFSFVIGLLTGFPGVVVSLYVSFLTGAAISLILIMVKKKRMRGSTIAFGPFLVIGTLVALFFGTQLWQIFLRFY
jgi:leader peptidase (prepilin peptidase)/N-methyltransferase